MASVTEKAKKITREYRAKTGGLRPKREGWNLCVQNYFLEKF